MPRFPDNQTGTKQDHMTDLIKEQPQQIIDLEMVRDEKMRKETISNLQMEERIEDFSTKLADDINKLNERPDINSANGLTRRSVELIEEHLAKETSQLSEDEKKQFNANFTPRKNELIRKAAIMEQGARESLFEDNIKKATDRLQTRLMNDEDVSPDDMDDILMRIDVADLEPNKKAELANTITHQITMATHQQNLRRDPALRQSFIDGKIAFDLTPSQNAFLRRYAEEEDARLAKQEMADTYEIYDNIKTQIMAGDVSLDEVRDDIGTLPKRLKLQLEREDKIRRKKQQASQRFNSKPQDKKAAFAYMDQISSARDIFTDDKSERDVLLIAGRAGTISPLVINTMRRSIETRDPERFMKVGDMAEKIEQLLPDAFSHKRYDSLTAGMLLAKLVRRRNTDERAAIDDLRQLIAPDKPLSQDDIQKRHGSWATDYALNSYERPEDAQKFASQLMRRLIQTNGAREEAIEIAEVMHTQGKKPSNADQQVNRAEKEDRLDIKTYSDEERKIIYNSHEQ